MREAKFGVTFTEMSFFLLFPDFWIYSDFSVDMKVVGVLSQVTFLHFRVFSFELVRWVFYIYLVNINS